MEKMFNPELIPDVLDVHVIASGEVKIFPECPTITHNPAPYATPRITVAKPVVRAVQVVPFDEVEHLELAPTATQSEFA
jgi:hypothetical protein